MRTAREILDQQFLEMRWRCLSLAADLDRVQNAPEGVALLKSDPRLAELRSAIELLNGFDPNRAEKVQLIFSDRSK